MTLGEIKTAINELSDKERAELATWLLSLDRAAWDRQIEADFSAGGAGDDLLKKVDAAIEKWRYDLPGTWKDNPRKLGLELKGPDTR
jgi:hypothetical protein